jgi:hypothetical protein
MSHVTPDRANAATAFARTFAPRRDAGFTIRSTRLNFTPEVNRNADYEPSWTNSGINPLRSLLFENDPSLARHIRSSAARGTHID